MSRRLIYVLTILALLIGMVGFQPVKPVLAANNLRISQVSGEGGAPDSVYKDRFIELFNAGNAQASLSGLSLQYGDSNLDDLGNDGAFNVVALPDEATIKPGGYYLIKVTSFDIEKPPIPEADYDLTQLQPFRIIDNAYGKLALVQGTEPLGCSSTANPCNEEQLARIIDRVAYGGVNFYEGAGGGPLAGTGISIQRKAAGCQDTDQNDEDLIKAPPIPRNAATEAHSCAPTSNPDAIFFSEYIEGSSFNKALEIYNATGATVDLSDIKIELYPNGATSPAQSVVLFGTLVDKGTFVAAHNQAAQDILDKAQLTDGTVVNFNGDDAVVLRRVSTDAVLDTIGQVGNRPAAGYWGTGDVTTKDDTLVRKPDVCAGDTTPDDAYDPANEWLGYPINTFTHLGSHESNCNQTPIPGPKVQSIVPANNAMAPKTTDIVITFSEEVTVEDGWYDVTCTETGTHTATVTEENPVFTLNPDEDFTPDETCTVTIDKDKVTNADDETMAENFVSSFTIVEGCGDTFTPIYEIQGNGPASLLVDEIVTTEGVVTANFQVGGKSGYAIQDSEGDNNPATSDGIFVYSTNPTVNVGDRLRITGKVTEYYNMTQITPTSAATVLTCSTGQEITPTEITLPVNAPRDFEQYEGMLVTFPQALYLAEYFNFDRYGEIVLSGTRHNTPTSVVEPGDEAVAAEQAYILDSIKVDDTLTSQNPPYLRHPDGSQFTKEHYFRGGDTIKGLTGIMDYNFNEWKIQPVGTATYTQLNPRPDAPVMVPGEIRIASLNVLNYFVTLDDGSNNCGPAGNMNCRGADNQEEFERQHDKIVAAILGMEADVIGLIEIENEHPNMDADGAVKHLVAALNTETADGTYAYVATGNIGTDAIKQAFIYKPAKVDLVGKVAILDESFDEAYDTTRNRPSLAVSFKDKITDEIFTVSVNHLKSKGSACEGDPDLGDGQGNCNLTRKRAAEVLVKWLETDPTEANSDMYVIIGDLNSYAKEDPIDAIKLGADELEGTADDVTNLVEQFNEPEAYGYVFDGKAGYLDHALANKKFAYYVLDAKFWHINADEADVFDYDNSFKPAEQAALYSPDAYRSSDHDPILISLILNHAPVANDDEYSTNMGVTLEVPAPGVLANDTDANEDDIITATLVEGSGPANGDLTLNSNGSFTYIPNPGFAGVDTFEYTMHATPGLMDNYSDTATVTINVKAGVGFKDGGAIYIAQSRPDGRHLLGVSGDFTVQGMVLNEAQSLEMKLYAGTEEEPQLLQTNTIKSMDVFGPTATTFTSSFDIFGVYTSSSWDNVKETEYGQTVPATHVVATVTMPNGYTFSRTAWITNERDIIIRGDIAPQDFGYAAISGVKGVSAGFEITDMGNLRGAQSLVVKLYSGEETDLQLLQTNTAVLDGGQFDNFLQFSTPFDIFGDFNYEADGYWTNVREPEYGQTVEPTCVEATVTFLNDTTKTARNCNRTGDRRWIVSTLDEEIRTAPEYGYPDGYEYGGDFEFNDDENIYTVTYKPAQVLAGKPTADIARYLGALYRQDGATINGITFNGVDYTWKFDPPSVPELKGSNWRDADNKTLVSAIAAYMASPDYDPAAGFTLTVTDGYNTETVTFIVIITNTLDAEIGSGFDYEYDPAYTYVGSRVFDDANNVYTVTYKETEIAPHAMNDLARYLGALHRQDDATIIAIAYKGTTYTWNAEGTLLGSNWEDAEGNTLVSVITADFLGGAIDPAVGIVLTVADGIHTETVTFKMIITNVAPVLDPIADETIPELVEYTFTATASDVPTATLTFSLVGAPEGAVIDATTGVFTWRPTEAQGPGEYTFTVKVCDDGNPVLCDEQEVKLNVTEVNVAPVLAEIGDKEVTEGEELTFTATATDEDIPAQALTFSMTGAPAGATLDSETGEFAWTPTEEQGPGVYNVTFKVCDDGNPELCDEQVVKITVNEANEAPIFKYPIEDQTIDELTPFSWIFKATDSDKPDQTISYSIEDAPTGSTFDSTKALFEWTPSEAQGPGEYTITVKACDNFDPQACGIATFTITVLEVNLPPTIHPIPDQEVDELSELTFTATAMDPDLPLQALTFSLENAPDGAVINPVTGFFTWTPGVDMGTNDYTFQVCVTDIAIKVCTDVTVTVNDIPMDPVAVDDAYTTDEDVVLTVEAPGVLANDTDPDSPVLTAVLEEGPTHGTLVLNANGSFTYTPELNYHGTDSFTYKASDGTHESNIATVTITINPVNDAPVALDDAYTVAEDAVLTVAAAEGVLANDYDVDGDALAPTLRTNVSHGVLVLLSDGSFTYTPEADFFGTDSFTYTLLSHPNTQDEGWTDWATVTITVTPVNDAPVLDEIPDFTIFTLEELSFIATASDVDDTELTFSLVDAPEGAAIESETGEFTWTPTVEQVGEHEIELCVSDGELEDCQTFKVTVLPLNQAPIAVADAYEVAQDGVLSVAAPGVLENDSDPEDAELTAELVTTTQFGTLILNPNGSFIYVPNEGYAGVDSFTYKAFDGELYSEEVTVTITVMAPPVWGMFFPIILN